MTTARRIILWIGVVSVVLLVVVILYLGIVTTEIVYPFGEPLE